MNINYETVTEIENNNRRQNQYTRIKIHNIVKMRIFIKWSIILYKTPKSALLNP